MCNAKTFLMALALVFGGTSHAAMSASSDEVCIVVSSAKVAESISFDVEARYRSRSESAGALLNSNPPTGFIFIIR